MASSTTDFMKPSSWDKQTGAGSVAGKSGEPATKPITPLTKNEVRNEVGWM